MSLAPVLKVKKLSLNSAQAALNAAKARQQAAIKALDEAKEALSGLKNLKITSPQDAMLYSEYAANLRANIDAAAEKVSLCDKEITHYEHLYKKANLDYEKIRALVDEELARAKYERDRKATLELDEIATMLFSRQS